MMAKISKELAERIAATDTETEAGALAFDEEFQRRFARTKVHVETKVYPIEAIRRLLMPDPMRALNEALEMMKENPDGFYNIIAPDVYDDGEELHEREVIELWRVGAKEPMFSLAAKDINIHSCVQYIFEQYIFDKKIREYLLTYTLAAYIASRYGWRLTDKAFAEAWDSRFFEMANVTVEW